MPSRKGGTSTPKSTRAKRPKKAGKPSRTRSATRAPASRTRPTSAGAVRKPANAAAQRAQQVFVAFVMDQLSRLSGVRTRAMFGGHGLYQGEDFFGIVHQARLYFRVNDVTRTRYEKCDMEPFRPVKGPKLGKYYEVPPDVIEDPKEITAWAREAVGAAGN